MNQKLKNTLYGLGAGLLAKKSSVHGLHTQQNIAQEAAFLRSLRSQNTQAFAMGFLDKNNNTVFVTNGEEIGKNTLFRLASITKFVIGIACMRLVERGLLGLDVDVVNYLGEDLRNPKYPEVAITLRQILSHSSSLIDSPAYFTALQVATDYKACIAHHEGKPGERFVYSNFATGLMEIILEKRTGKSLEEILQEEIFQPLGIEGTFFPHYDRDIPAIYRVFPKAKQPNYILDEKLYKDNLAYQSRPLVQRYTKAAGALFMSAKGLLVLLQTLLEDSKGAGILLGQESLAQMQSPIVAYPNQARHLHHGIATLIVEDEHIFPRKLYGHQGFAYGAVNGAFYDVEGEKAFVFLNAGTREWRNGHFAKSTEAMLNCYAKELA